MKISSKKLFKILSIAAAAILWLLIWEIVALSIGNSFVFPGALKTFVTFAGFLTNASFWKTALASIARIIIGFVLGILLGCLLAFLCKSIKFLYEFISTGMTVVKSTPVASIIMILWIIVDDRLLPILIAVLMVCPIIWQNLMNGYNAIDKDLSEVCAVFEFSKKQRLKLLVFPTLYRYFVPAALTSVGLAWKSGIAAEIISYTSNSIGKHIYLSKNNFDGHELLAWTLTVVIISLAFEFSVKGLFKRLESRL